MVLALGAVIFGGTGTLLVRASEHPEMLRVMREFNEPIRRAVQPFLPRAEAPLPQIFRPKSTVPAQALGYAPRTDAFRPLPRLPEATLPARHLDNKPLRATLSPGALFPETAGHLPKPERARHALHARAKVTGASTAMNYCVRLCDGFAFPVGHSGTDAWNIQESACRSACPGADTALFSAAAGAKDFDALSRGGLAYSSLPNAFRYRQAISESCSCRPVGATQSTAALLSDTTLHRGDLVMTRTGIRHFDGATRVPYRANHFSDAVKTLKNKREVAMVRAMEMASLPGIMSVRASDEVRARVASDIRAVERSAVLAGITDTTGYRSAGHPRGFAELQARERRGTSVLPSVKRAPGLVALN